MTKITFGIATRISTLERKKYLEEAIESLLAQTNPNWELIISDDVSPIDPEYSKYKNHPQIQIFQQKETLGIFKNFNFCLDQTQTELFLPLGDDDILEYNFVEKVLEFYEENKEKEIDIICFNYKFIEANGNIYFSSNIQDSFYSKGPELLNHSLYELYSDGEKKMIFCAVIKTESLKKLGGYKDYGMVSDIYFIYTFSLAFNFGFLGDHMIRIRHHKDNHSGIKKIDILRKEQIELNTLLQEKYGNLFDSEVQTLFKKHQDSLLNDHVMLLRIFKEQGRIAGIKFFFSSGFSLRKTTVFFFGIIFGSSIHTYLNYFIILFNKIKYYTYHKI